MRLNGHAEFLERFERALERREVGIASHDDGYLLHAKGPSMFGSLCLLFLF